ncbi:MAG: type II toxin-antitoxin system HicB family antitoxin [Prevotella sp.]|nr:type II toxin-antitoxin system HicB family antitoxin [Prevotella sp.]
MKTKFRYLLILLIIFVSCDKQNDDHTSSHFHIDKDYYEIIQWRDQTINIISGSGDLQISTPNADKIQLSYEKGSTESGIKPKKPYSGNLNVRLTPEIHSRLAVLAQQAGTTINGYIRQTLAKATGVTL